MKCAPAVAGLLLTGTAWSNSFYDCPQRMVPKSEYQRIAVAAKVERVEVPERQQVHFCRQRGDGTLYANFDTGFVVREDGSESWKHVLCADEASEPGGWSCGAGDRRGLKLRLSPSLPVSTIALPEDMPATEARELIAQGYAALEAMNSPGGCERAYCTDVELRLINEEAAKPGEWWLERADVAGEYRLVKDPYYVQFARAAEDGAVKARARLDSYEYLE